VAFSSTRVEHPPNAPIRILFATVIDYLVIAYFVVRLVVAVG
jgi:hypothetical protein